MKINKGNEYIYIYIYIYISIKNTDIEDIYVISIFNSF